MLIEQGAAIPSMIFDDKLEVPRFETTTPYTRSPLEVRNRLPELSHFVVCIGGEHGLARATISQFLITCGLAPLQVIHQTSFIDQSARIGVGLQMMPSTTIHKFTHISDFVIVNTAATVDHDCHLGLGVQVMGSAAIAGGVTIGDYSTIGTNATVLPDLRIGEGSYIGAGSVVTKDIPENVVAYGSPARVIREISHTVRTECFDAFVSE